MDLEIVKTEIINILESEQETVKLGGDGDYEQYQGVLADSFPTVAEKVASFIWSITDPENQPNQYGIFASKSTPSEKGVSGEGLQEVRDFIHNAIPTGNLIPAWDFVLAFKKCLKYIDDKLSSTTASPTVSGEVKDKIYSAIHENIMKARVKLRKVGFRHDVDDTVADLVESIFNDVTNVTHPSHKKEAV